MSTPPSGEPPYPGSQPDQPGPDRPNDAGRGDPGQSYPAPDRPAQGYPDQGYQNQAGYPPHDHQQGGYQAYPQEGYGGAPPTQPRNGLGITALVLGILAVLSFWTVLGGIVLGLLALIFGIIGLVRVNKGVATNKGVSIAGIVLGALGLIGSVALIAIGSTIFLNTGGGNYVQCAQQAGGDRAQIEQCAQQYQQQVQDQFGRPG